MSSSPEQEEHLSKFGEGTSPMGIHKQNDQWRKHAQARNHPYGHSAKSALLNKRDPRLFPRKFLKSLGAGGRVNEPLLEVPMLEKMSKTPPMGTMITPPTSPVILSGIPWQKSSEIPDDILNFPNPEGTMKSPEVNFIINKVCIQCAEYRSKIDELEIKSDEIKNAIKTINSDIDQFEIESNEKFEIEMTIQNSGNSVETSSDDEEITKLTKDIVGIENIDLISENKRIKQEAENLKKELFNMKFNAQLELQIKSQHIKDLEDSKSQKENKRLRQENEDLKNELSNLKFNSEKEIEKKSLRIKELEGQEDNLKKELSNLKSKDQIKSKYIKELEGQEDPREIQRLNLEADNLKKELSNFESNDQIKSKYIKELEDKNGQNEVKISYMKNLSTKYKDLKIRYCEKNTDNEGTISKLNDKCNDIIRCNDKLQEINSKYDKQLQNLSFEKSTIVTELESKEKELNRFQNRVSELEKEISNLTEEFLYSSSDETIQKLLAEKAKIISDFETKSARESENFQNRLTELQRELSEKSANSKVQDDIFVDKKFDIDLDKKFHDLQNTHQELVEELELKSKKCEELELESHNFLNHERKISSENQKSNILIENLSKMHVYEKLEKSKLQMELQELQADIAKLEEKLKSKSQTCDELELESENFIRHEKKIFNTNQESNILIAKLSKVYLYEKLEKSKLETDMRKLQEQNEELMHELRSKIQTCDELELESYNFGRFRQKSLDNNKESNVVIEKLSKLYLYLKLEKSKLENNFESKSREHSQATEKCESLEAKIIELENFSKKIIEKCCGLQEDYNALEKKYKKLQTENSQMAEELNSKSKNLTDEIEKCQNLGKKVSSLKEYYTKKVEEKYRLQDQISQLEEEASIVSNEHKKIMAKNQEQFQTQITSLNKELEEFKTEKAVLVEKLVTISEEVDSSNSKYETYRNNYTELEKNWKGKVEDLKDLNDKNSKITEELANASKELKKSNQKVEETSVKIETLEKQIQEGKIEKSRLTEKIRLMKINSLKNEVEEKAKLRSLTKDFENCTAKNKDLVTKINESNQNYRNLEEKYSKLSISNRKLSKADSELRQALEKELADLKLQNFELDEKNSKLSTANRKLIKISEMKDNLEKEVTGLKTQNSELTEKCSKFVSTNRKLTKNSEEIKENLEKKATELKTENSELTEKCSKLITVNRKLSKNSELKDNLEKELTKLKTENSELSEKNSKLISSNKNLAKVSDKNEELEIQVQDLKNQNSDLTEKISAFNSQNRKLGKNSDKYEAKIKELEIEKQKSQEKLVKLQSHVSKTEEEMSEDYQNYQSTISSLTNSVNDLENSLKESEIKNGQLTKNIIRLKARSEHKAEQLQELEQQKNEFHEKFVESNQKCQKYEAQISHLHETLLKSRPKVLKPSIKRK